MAYPVSVLITSDLFFRHLSSQHNDPALYTVRQMYTEINHIMTTFEYYFLILHDTEYAWAQHRICWSWIQNKSEKPRAKRRKMLETLIRTFVLQRWDFNPSLNETPLQCRSADLMKDLGFITANNAGHESVWFWCSSQEAAVAYLACLLGVEEAPGLNL